MRKASRGRLEDLVRDLQYGLRTWNKNPAFALLAVATLALGIGANTAIFSVIHGVLLKSLPYREGDRLVLIRQLAPLAGPDEIPVSIREVHDYREHLESFEEVVEYHSMSFILLHRGEPDRVETGVVSANFFHVLGIEPILGRTFAEADDDPGAEAVLVLSHGYWLQRFGGDPGVVGDVFQMNDRPHTVVGVLPPIPQYPRDNDVYMPTSACPFRAQGERRMDEDRRAFAALRAFGRLAPGASRERVETDVATVAARFGLDHPAIYRPEDSGFTAVAVPLHEELTSRARPLLFVLLGTTALVLLIACANVAGLSLALMARRERELALRIALGAGRMRLLRQVLTESTLLSVTGGVLGLLLAWLVLDVLTAFVSRFTARTGEIEIDASVLAFTLGVSAGTGLVFGTLPALWTRLDVSSALKEGSAGAGSGAGSHRLRSALVLAQVAISFAVLVGAGLLLASFYKLRSVDLGFEPERVMTAEIFPNWTKYATPADTLRLYRPVLDRLENHPEVLSAAVANAVPLSDLQPSGRPFEIEGRRVEDPIRRPAADVNVVSDGYFATLGIPLLRGRTFDGRDHEDAAAVVVVNRSMAAHWDDTDPIGSRISFDRGASWSTVVGIVGDVRQHGLDRQAIAQVYVPLLQSGGTGGGRVLVRTHAEPSRMTRLIKETVHSVDPDQAVENVRTLEELRSERLATPRVTALLLTVFAGLALVITVTGITGVVATSVSQRTREFGIRMALGASRMDVLGMVLRQGLLLLLAGLAAGLAGALVMGRLLTSYLYETEPADPLTLGAVSLLFLCAGLAACLGPARRATSIEPVSALRVE